MPARHTCRRRTVLAKLKSIVIVDALNHAFDEEMNRDAQVVVFGQDVAHGKGGVFGVTRHLTAKYGWQRCFNTPLAESTIIGIAIGMSFVYGFKPVAEIQFADYVWTGSTSSSMNWPVFTIAPMASGTAQSSSVCLMADIFRADLIILRVLRLFWRIAQALKWSIPSNAPMRKAAQICYPRP